MPGETYAEAIGRAIVEAMESDPKIVLLGSGATDFKGVFGTTLEATRRFPDRCYDVPNSEAAIGGIVCGLATQGYHPLLHHHRIDFATYSFDSIVNLLAKWAATYQTDPLPVTIRMIVGRGWGQGSQHSQFLGSTFAHFPGLTVAAPWDAESAGDLLTDALRRASPTLIVEHRALYQDRGRVQSAPWFAEGPPQVTVASCSVGVRESRAAARTLWDQYAVKVEVVPVVHLRPPGFGKALHSLWRTRHLVVLDPGWATFGFSAEVLARAAESGFLEAGIRVAPPAVPAPTSAPLEAAYWPGADAVVQAVLRMLGRDAEEGRCVTCQAGDHYYCQAAPCTCPCWDRSTERAAGEPRPDAFTGPY